MECKSIRSKSHARAQFVGSSSNDFGIGYFVKTQKQVKSFALLHLRKEFVARLIQYRSFTELILARKVKTKSYTCVFISKDSRGTEKTGSFTHKMRKTCTNIKIEGKSTKSILCQLRNKMDM